MELAGDFCSEFFQITPSALCYVLRSSVPPWRTFFALVCARPLLSVPEGEPMDSEDVFYFLEPVPGQRSVSFPELALLRICALLFITSLQPLHLSPVHSLRSRIAAEEEGSKYERMGHEPLVEVGRLTFLDPPLPFFCVVARGCYFFTSTSLFKSTAQAGVQFYFLANFRVRRLSAPCRLIFCKRHSCPSAFLPFPCFCSCAGRLGHNDVFLSLSRSASAGPSSLTFRYGLRPPCCQ